MRLRGLVSTYQSWLVGRASSAHTPHVVLYKAAGCRLCERARETLDGLRTELGFEFDEIAIDGDRELERRYRELIPVVEIDGERACTFYVQPEPFKRRLARAQTGSQSGSL